MMRRPARLAVLAAALGAAAPALAADDFLAGLEAWKRHRIERLQQPDGWLTLVGLAWLAPGDNAVGSAADAAVRLPEGKAPARLGTLRVTGERVTFVPAAGAEVRASGAPVSAPVTLVDDAEGAPTVLAHGSLSFYLIERAGRLAIRIKDAEAATLRAFRGLEYFPADPGWRVPARFEPAPAGSVLEVPNAMGYLEPIAQPGWVVFERDGRSHRLIALDDTGDGRLFLVFGDLTNGHETYGGGRFVYTDPPRDGRVEIDFNRAYSPPCVFTPYATCPLPPPGNKLPMRVEAGEKTYAGAGH